MILNHRSLGRGPNLVILHGLFGSLDNWMSLAKQLASHYTVHLVDLRNHGDSFHGDDFNYDAMASDIKLLVDALGIDSFSIIGHSMGGKVAMFYSAYNEYSVENLIIVDIAPRYYPVHHQQILDGLASIDIDAITSRNQADEQLASHIHNQGIRQFLLKNLKRNSNNSFTWKINLPVISEQIENVGAALPASLMVQVPTLFIKGGTSDYIRSGDYEDIHKQFPNARINNVPGVGHWVHAEAPRELLNMVREFLE